MYDGVIECDSDGDPRMSFIPVNRDKEIEKEEVEMIENPPLPSEDKCVYDRDAMVAYDDKGKPVEIGLNKDVVVDGVRPVDLVAVGPYPKASFIFLLLFQ